MVARLATYSFDTSSLVHAWNRAYPPTNFPRFWKNLDGLIDRQRLVCTDQVLDDLRKKDDGLHAWCKERAAMFVAISDPLQDRMLAIMARYPRLVDTKKGRSASDPWVIALAKLGDPLVVVCEESTAAKDRMPHVCTQESIECVNLLTVIQRENWVFG